ncbi:hypothetical protein [Pseudarthrobacter sulfonivorans]|uniref:hypothetical protein n=1 Tax=Pseudarthrobacter sulfonivorans TaxID=121292 RepID=UPI00168BA7BA|nr:hypothetical protein [Pseudarthrobacter sulfonivorans]
MSGSILIRTLMAKGLIMTTGTNEQNDEFVEFDAQAISATFEAARQPFEGRDLGAEPDFSAPSDRGELELRATCLSVVSRNRRVCLKLPLGIGQVCIPVPFDIPEGTAVKACLSIRFCCFGTIPTGVCVTLDVAGERIAKKCFP